MVGRYYYLQIECDNGQTYTIKELAALFGVSQQYVSTKIRHYGWDSEKVLQFEKVPSNSRPTRILKKPQLVRTKEGRKLRIKCDDGRVYTVKELADTIGVAPSGLSARINGRGWDSPDVLDYEKHDNAEEWMQTSPYKTIIPGDLAHLSDTHTRNGERVYY